MPVTRKKPISAKMIAEPSIGSTWLAYLRIVLSKMCWAASGVRPAFCTTSIVSSRVYACSNCEHTIASMLLHGHTFTREPMMKPARTIMVSFCQRARSQWRNFENARIPITAPMANTPMMRRLWPTFTPATRSEIHPMMNSYLPRIRRMKLPEMPGRIIAQMAMAPLRKMNQYASGVWVGDKVHTVTPSPTPRIMKSMSRSFHPLIPRRMNIDEATMRPKKKAHVWIGCHLRRYCIRLAREMMLMPIPMMSESRKLPLMCFQNALNLPLKRSFTASALMDAREPTNSSYMPMMKAIVPPDTPGITSAAPMHAPLTATVIYFNNPFILFLLENQ